MQYNQSAMFYQTNFNHLDIYDDVETHTHLHFNSFRALILQIEPSVI